MLAGEARVATEVRQPRPRRAAAARSTLGDVMCAERHHRAAFKIRAAIERPSGKTSVHASFDRDVVEFLKRDGRGCQTRMNAVLRRYMEAQQAQKPAR